MPLCALSFVLFSRHEEHAPPTFAKRHLNRSAAARKVRHQHVKSPVGCDYQMMIQPAEEQMRQIRDPRACPPLHVRSEGANAG